MKRIICFCLLIVFVGCKRGNHQVIALRNSTSNTIYFVLSGSGILTNPDEVTKVRPVNYGLITELNVEYEDKEQERSINENLYRYRIESNSLTTLLSSESVEIFVDAVSIQRIIKERYDGKLQVFIIAENDLLNHSDQEIIDKRLYKHFKTLTPEDIKKDTLILEYF